MIISFVRGSVIIQRVKSTIIAYMTIHIRMKMKGFVEMREINIRI